MLHATRPSRSGEHERHPAVLFAVTQRPTQGHRAQHCIERDLGAQAHARLDPHSILTTTVWQQRKRAGLRRPFFTAPTA
ncbi:hypothetical protein XFF6970_440042 [Xanthomonas citri pv. fuscans]|nr:hypothetical protein XFF6970_440042 [Xanthomonas citri pv. fuscans]